MLHFTCGVALRIPEMEIVLAEEAKQMQVQSPNSLS